LGLAYTGGGVRNRGGWNGEKGESSKGGIHEYVNEVQNEAITFFFTNYPENFKVVDLLKVMQCWGKVVDVYIPLERDRNGRKFGFVRFKEVQNVQKRREELG